MFKAHTLCLAAALVLAACQTSPPQSTETIAGAPAEAAAEAPQPNVIVILADDLAYTDLSVYGGEIRTPNLQRIANNGLAFTRFLTAPMCSPSRAMLMTGNAAHKSGFGTMAEHAAPQQRGKPGYEGYLNSRVVTMAEVLSDAGYQTHFAGKWHLGAKSPPHERGFERSFTLIEGAGSHFDNTGYGVDAETVTYLEQGEPVDLPEDFYSSDFYTDKIIDYWETRDTDKPFFAYLPFTAPHWPLHAPAEDIERYKGRYSEGYEVLRRARFEALKELGLIDASAAMPDSLPFVPKWETLTPEQQALEAREMAVYAAMVDRIDQNVGRLLDRLDADGALENTIIMFSSDNGPDALDFTTRPILPPVTDWIEQNFDNSLDSLGSANSYPFYGAPWAEAGAAPHRYYKTYVTLGGSQTPFLMSWPGGVSRQGWVSETASMMDVAPTVYEAAGAVHPGAVEEAGVYAPDGRSMLDYLTGSTSSIHNGKGISLELFGHQSMVSGDWRILRLRPPEGNGEWGLYNLTTDPGEQIDLKEVEPERFADMLAEYNAWADDVGLILVDDDFQMFGGLVLRARPD